MINTNSPEWQAVEALANREIASLKDSLATDLPEKKTVEKRAEIRVWLAILDLGKPPEQPVQTETFGL